MNPLPNEWAITHRADTCAVTHRPFVAGEYFYTLLYLGADGYRREDLSEEAWRNRNENIQPFSFWKSCNTKWRTCYRLRHMVERSTCFFPGFSNNFLFTSRQWPGCRTKFSVSSAKNMALTFSRPNSFLLKESSAAMRGRVST